MESISFDSQDPVAFHLSPPAEPIDPIEKFLDSAHLFHECLEHPGASMERAMGAEELSIALRRAMERALKIRKPQPMREVMSASLTSPQHNPMSAVSFKRLLPKWAQTDAIKLVEGPLTNSTTVPSLEEIESQDLFTRARALYRLEYVTDRVERVCSGAHPKETLENLTRGDIKRIAGQLLIKTPARGIEVLTQLRQQGLLNPEEVADVVRTHFAQLEPSAREAATKLTQP